MRIPQALITAVHAREARRCLMKLVKFRKPALFSAGIPMLHGRSQVLFFCIILGNPAFQSGHAVSRRQLDDPVTGTVFKDAYTAAFCRRLVELDGIDDFNTRQIVDTEFMQFR